MLVQHVALGVLVAPVARVALHVGRVTGLAGRLLLFAPVVEGEDGVVEGGVAPVFGGVAVAAAPPVRAVVFVVLGVAREAVLRGVLDTLVRAGLGVAVHAGHVDVLAGELERRLAVVEVGAVAAAAVVARQAVLAVGGLVLAHERRVDRRVTVGADGLVELP